jgi:hypothetical protein
LLKGGAGRIEDGLVKERDKSHDARLARCIGIFATPGVFLSGSKQFDYPPTEWGFFGHRASAQTPNNREAFLKDTCEVFLWLAKLVEFY